MAQYLLPRSDQPRLPELMRDGGKVAFKWMDDGPSKTDGARWWRFTCSAGTSRVAGCIGEHQELPETIVVSVGLDARRLPLVCPVPADLRLVHRLIRVLKEAGATQLRHED